jgi:hypothetical protein
VTRRDRDADQAVVLPFGKYKDWLLMDVPADYLRWLLEGDKIRSEALRQAVYAEWSWRQHQRSRREVKS